MGGDEEMKTSIGMALRGFAFHQIMNNFIQTQGKCGHLLVIDPVNHKDWGLTRSSSNTQKIILERRKCAAEIAGR